MRFGQAVAHVLRNYATFSGRAPRSELWWFSLFTLLLGLACNIVDAGLGTHDVIRRLVSLAMLLPSIAVGVRRLHDIDRSGWWSLLALVPLVGWVVLIVWYCTRGTPGANRFGPDLLGSL
jgi:uncharacterized membrane protein YhaH (DUF805 family)